MTTINLVDAGFKSLSTVGSMAAGSTELNVASNAGFHVGDSIIVAVGGEDGQGMRGTTGVGGAYAATTNDPALYYTNTDAPKALVAHVMSVGQDGHTLVLDQAAATSTTSASIYFDNKPVWDAVVAAHTESNVTLDIPAGHFAISDPLALSNRSGWTVEGAGKGATELFSPAGATSASIQVFQSDHATLQDFSLTGNAKMNGYGLGSQETYPPGIMFTLSDHGLAQNLTVTDVFQDAVGTRYSNDTWAYHVDAHLTEGLARYIQWQFDWANSTGGGVVDSSVDSPILSNGFEAFQSSGTSFIGIHGTNASMAFNSAGGFLVKDAVLDVTPDSWVSDLAFHRNNPLININSNISHTDPLLGAGGQIINTTLVQEGYINSNGNLLPGISIGNDNQNIVVQGGIYISPETSITANDVGALGLVSHGQNTVVDGFAVVAGSHVTNDGLSNISVDNGVVTNSIAGSISAPAGGASNDSAPSAALFAHAAEIASNPASALISHASPVASTDAAQPTPDPVVVSAPTPVPAPTPAPAPAPAPTPTLTPTPPSSGEGATVATAPHDTTDTSAHDGADSGSAGSASVHSSSSTNGLGSNSSIDSALLDWANQHVGAPVAAPASSSLGDALADFPFAGSFQNDALHSALQSWAGGLQAGSGSGVAESVHADQPTDQHVIQPVDHAVTLGWHFA